MFMSAMEATVVATAMPTVVADLSGLELYGWVGAIYMLAVTVTIPTWGKLADVKGRKPILLAGIGIFLLGCLGSGFATSMQTLIVMRAIQGIGAGSMQPITITIIGDIFTVEERARIQGIFGAVWGFSAMVGPLLGGLIVSALSWRWVFFINLPFGLLAALVLVLFYEEKRAEKKERKHLDIAGAASLSGAILALLLGVGGKLPAVTLPAAAVLLAAFVVVERRAEDPILPFPMLRRPVIRMGTIIGALMGAVMMGAIMYTPLFMQAVLGATPTEAGTSIAPMLIGWPIASAISGRLIPRFGYRPLVRLGLSFVGVGALALFFGLRHAHADPGSVAVWLVRSAAFVMGAGMGLANTAVIIAVQESVAHGQRGVATASTMFARSIGGAVIVGALGALLGALLVGKIPGHLLDELLAPGEGGKPKIDPTQLATYQGAIFEGMVPLFVIVAVLGAITAIAAFGFPAVEFRKSTANGELSDAAAG
ncbi:MAG: MDR family MFS transporter [Polyangiaceae bacterium]